LWAVPHPRNPSRPPPALSAPRTGAVLVCLLSLAACASYRAEPLAGSQDLANEPPRLTAKELRPGLPGLAPHPFNAGGRLDMADVATIAVVNNPGLKAKRLKSQVAAAQAFAAGLLPDPQISPLSYDVTTSSGAGLTDAFAYGLSYDFAALVTRGARIGAATAAAQQVDLDVLWQEWQTIQQARVLYVQFVHERRKLALLRQVQEIFAKRYAESSKALQRGDLTLPVVGTDLTALLDADTQVDGMRRQIDQTEHDLHALLGLMPKVALDLAPLGPPADLPRAVADSALESLPGRRPDLLALRAGYRSQEENVRRAILAQFPAIGVGVNRARDNSDVRSVGFSLTLTLPVFDGNRGQIAVQRATRAQLKQEYQARLDAAYGEVDMLLSRRSLIEQQIQNIDDYLPTLESMVAQARTAYQRRELDALTYLNMERTMLQKRLEKEDLDQALWMTGISLDTLLAWPEYGGAAPKKAAHEAPARRP